MIKRDFDLKDYNVYTSDPVLRAAVERGGARWYNESLVRQGAEYGTGATLQAAQDANRFKPELQTLSRQGERIDSVQFHPAWHTMMAMARRNGITNLPYNDTRASAWVGYGATLYIHSQIESGSACPSVMTKACIPVLRHNPALSAVMMPRLASTEYDARDIPLESKNSVAVGMGMTEKQGGSDLRTNTTQAIPSGRGAWGDEFVINGHKWFFSAPMCDGHLVLGKTVDHGLSCFFVPRWHGKGRKSAARIKALNDALMPRRGFEDSTLWWNLRRLYFYLENNVATLVNYGARYRKGLPISSSIAESAVNLVVSHRMAKKQQMRWTDEGAHCLAQVRVAALNGELSPARMVELAKRSSANSPFARHAA